MLMQIIWVQLTLYVTEKMPEKKQNFQRFFSWQNPIPIKVKKKIPKNSNNFHPVPASSTAGPCPTIIGLCRQNDNCVDPNQTDS